MLLDLSALDPLWQAAFELAWDAWAAGTIPVGAVVSAPDGRIVGRGRNRIFETSAPRGQVAGTWIAHAEINALVQLPPTTPYEGFTITSTTEPCLLCAGGIMMSLRGRVNLRYGADDPIAGGVAAALAAPQGRRREVVVEQLSHRGFVLFAEALTLAESLRRAPDGVVGAYYREHRPQLAGAIAEVSRTFDAWTPGPLQPALSAISEALADAIP